MPATVKRTPSSNPLYIGFKMTGLTIKIFRLSLKRKRDRILAKQRGNSNRFLYRRKQSVFCVFTVRQRRIKLYNHC